MGLFIYKKYKMSLTKRLACIVFVISTLFFPLNRAFAIDYTNFQSEIEIPKRDVNLILNSLISELTDKRTNLFVFYDSEPEKEAVLVLLGMGIKSNAFDHLMIQAPKEILIEFTKAGLKVASLAHDPGISTIVKMGLEEARKEVVDWLVKNELRAGGGNLTLSSYLTYDGTRSSVNFPFVLIHDPRNGNTEIVIYSSKKIKPPISLGSVTGSGVQNGNFWSMEEWIRQGKTTLSPFTVKVSGKVERSRYGGYLWKEGPIVDIDLQSPVPDFEFKELSVLDRQLLSLNKTLVAAKNAFEIMTGAASSVGNKISGATQSAWDKIRSGISNIINLGGASVSSLFFSPGNDNTTVVSLQDEIRSFREIIQRDGPDEADELRKTIERLESELETALQVTSEPKESPDIKVETAEMVDRVEINSASIQELTKIVHIGPARAEEIVRLRPFSSLDDLTRVPGIGAKTVADIKEQGLAYVIAPEKDDPVIEEVEKEDDTDKKETEKKASYDPCLSGKVDLNSAPMTDLVFLKGIGEVIAQRIIDHRKSSPFHSLNDLESVSGIGPTTLNNIKEQDCAYVKETLHVNPLPSNEPETKNDPKISLNDHDFHFHWDIGEDLPAGQILTIENKGDGPLVWEVKFKEWASLNQDSGTLSPKESVAFILSVDPTELEVGSHSTELTIESNDKESPTKISVSVTVLPPPRTAQGLVITEVKINEREFIELYNPTEEEINMDGWYLSYYSSERKWNEPYRNWEFPKKIVPPNSYFLIGVYEYPEENGNPDSDWELSTAAGYPYGSGQLANSAGSLAIFKCDPRGKGFEDINECRIDAVGWGETFVRRGEPSTVPDKGKSIVRRSNSKGEYIDNEDNSTDFSVRMPMPINSKGETGDLIPPDPITDLAVNCQEGGAVLEWTAPYDPDTPQEMLNYEIRYGKDWEDGTIITGPIEVSVAGTKESFTIKALNYGTRYEFGIVTIDSRNRSPVSNIVSCTTETIRYGSIWSGFQGNPQRSGKLIDPVSVGSGEPTVETLISGERDGDHIDDPILIDGHGSIYFRGKITTNGRTKEGLLAFDRDGKSKWNIEGDANRFSNPILLPDGGILTVFQEIMYERSMIMKIDRDGTIARASEMDDFYPVGQPVTEQGKVYLLLSSSDGMSGKLISIDPSNGNVDWEYVINESLSGDISPAIDERGSIYFSSNDTIRSIDRNGRTRWERSFPFIPSEGDPEYGRTSLSIPVVGGNTVYISVKGESEIMGEKRDSLYALDIEDPENELWRVEYLSGIQGLPVMNYNGDIFIFSFSDSVHKNTTIFGYNAQGEPLDGWQLSIPLGGMLESMVVDANNNLYGSFGDGTLRSFDADGNERWRIVDLELRRNHHLSMGHNGNLYLGGNRHLYRMR